ncbi:MAG: endolytic transglycosylase MltG [Blautia sp.]|nr:endolytic transglycosylase MltG [Blautia sp.]
MSTIRDKAGRAGLVLAGGFFRIALYVCVALLVFWIGKSSYNFGYQIFNQHAMSPGDGQEVTVVIKESSSVYDIGKTLEKKGLIRDAKVFFIQEKLSNYAGQLKPGTYLLSTAYTPNRIMGILAGDTEQEGVTAN